MLKGLHNRFRKQYQRFLKEIKNLKNKNNPHKIHELRVLSRRLRAHLTLLQQLDTQEKKIVLIRKHIKKITRALSPLRSHDVNREIYLEGIAKQKTISDRKILKRILPHLKIERKLLEKKIFKQFKSISLPSKLPPISNKRLAVLSKNKKLIRGLNIQIKQERLLCKKVLQNFQKQKNLLTLHQFRIRMKKYRYFVEIKSLLDDPKNGKKIKPFKLLQDQMGKIHDLDVFYQYLSNKKIAKRFADSSAQNIYQDFLGEIKNEIRQRLKKFLPQNETQIQTLLEKTP